MRISKILLLLVIAVFSALANAEPEKVITDFGFGPDMLLRSPLDEIIAAETLSLDDLTEVDRKASLARIQELPKLTELNFYGCDLSHVDENNPVPQQVKTVLLAGGKVSQGTLRWLAKFPVGTTLVVGCDVHGLKLEFGKFSWLTFDNCTMSKSAVLPLVEKMTQVTFKEVTFAKEK
jgi:uncharacterized protein YjbI with pentapeptide repeats